MQPHDPLSDRSNLPVARTSFVGRASAIAEVKRLLAEHHVLTLSGSGGCGKTRLALRVAEDLRAEYADGVWWVDLAALGDARLLPQTIAATVGLREQPDRTSTEQLRDFVTRRSALLILDNCEHLRPACRDLLRHLSDPRGVARVLLTSREPIRAAGEQVWRVPLLELPDPGAGMPLEQLATVEAVCLFTERAQTVAPGFVLNERNAGPVAMICRRVEGLALAIELAAARCTVLTPKEIVERLDNSIGLLTRAAYGSDARHRMLRAAIDWSFDLLARPEQTLFMRLAVFMGSFNLASVEGVCAGGGLEHGDLLDLLASLVESSLVVAAEHGDHMRYRLLEPIRQYAVEQLLRSGDEQHWREQHNSYFLTLAELAEPKFGTHEQPAWLERVEREHDNLQAALAWCASAGRTDVGLRLSSLLYRFWLVQGHLSLGQHWLGEFLGRVDDTIEPDVQSLALSAQGRLYAAQSEFAASRASYEQSLLYAQHAEDENCIEIALIGFGATLWDLGDFAAAQTVLEQAVAICREMGHTWTLASAYGNLGLVFQYGGDIRQARTAYEQTVETASQAGNRSVLAITLMNLANLAKQQGDYPTAKARYDEALAAHRELGDRSGAADTLLNLGELHTGLTELRKAGDYFDQAEQIYRALGNEGDQGYVAAGRGDIAFHRRDYATACARYQHALRLFRAAGNRRLIGRSLGFLGNIAVREGRLADAAALCAEGLSERRAIGHRAGLIFALDHGYIELALALGRPAVAARLAGAVEAAREALERPRTPIEARAAEGIASTLRSQLGDRYYIALANEGRSMDLDQAAVYAQGSLSPSSIEQPAPQLRIFALGPVRVYRGERLMTSADWTYAKARELVLYLLFHPHATREQIGAELWPEASTEQVRQRFSNALAHARNALGRDLEWISLESGRYSFNRGQPIWIDVDAFEAALFEAQLLLRNGKENERAAGLLAEAVTMYSDDFAYDVHDGEWHIARREALRHAFLEALTALGRIHARAGREEQAITVLQRAVDVDAYLEEAHLELIQTYARIGKRRQAFAQYKKLQSALAELHALPSPETMALMQSLQHGEPL